MFFKYNDKPGKGVVEIDPNKPRILLFFEVLWRKLWTLFEVNVFNLIISIPMLILTFIALSVFISQIYDFIIPLVATDLGISENDILNVDLASTVVTTTTIVLVFFSWLFSIFIGQGPTTAGITYMLKNYANEEHVWFFSDWWKKMKANFRQSLLLWLIDIFATIVLINALIYYSKTNIAIAYIIVFTFVIYLIMHFYIYQLIITFKTSIFTAYKNAAILTLLKAPQNLALLLIEMLIHAGVPYLGIMFGLGPVFWCIYIFAELLLMPALTRFMIAFFINPQIDMCMSESVEKIKIY